ncbi:pyridoxal phosphate-dependent transferase [Jimgerdemannia flammicorona]|uniref:acetylornithine transaminase n=1 Tax=Jimgerdemannia flammicorona TaxID=994334 RepID=A0A433Q1M5_9FUNG|nr:pyridoxal phosphate-dependent transferase [Jimgerdemannia flammicorona]
MHAAFTRSALTPLRAAATVRAVTQRRAASSAAAVATGSTKTVSKPTHPDTEPDAATAAAISRYEKYTINTYSRPPVLFTRGSGVHMYDSAGREFMDFSAGIAVNALGHSDPELARVLHEQANQVMHFSNLFYNEHAGRLAELLVTSVRDDPSAPGFNAGKVFFANSGTEANEGALKFARKWGKLVAEKRGRNPEKKYGVVAFTNAFHGRSLGALSATYNPKYQEPFAPLVPGFVTAPFNDVAGLDAFVNEETCAVIVEPVQGEGGVHPASEEFLRTLRKKCDEVGALLIFDEIQCGIGRTGKLWAHQHYPTDCHPDILTMAKPLANGFPIGAIMTTDRVADTIKIGDHGTTFGGSPLACRAALSVFSRIRDASFLSHVRDVGAHLERQLGTHLQERHPSLITEVRGRGLILGLQFARDPTSLVKMARERGLIIITAAGNSVRIMPPLIITKEQADKGVRLLAEAVDEFAATA